MEYKRRMIPIGKTVSLYLCKMSENGPFFEHMQCIQLQKVLVWQKNYKVRKHKNKTFGNGKKLICKFYIFYYNPCGQ